MKKAGQKFWNSLSLSHKISLIGSVMLIGSLFLKWFSDLDVYRSGDQYTGLSGPLYFVGFNLLMVAIANLVLIMGKSGRWRLLSKFSESQFGKYQMIAGFTVMYLLMIVNSVYFHPQFGLNILSKKSEMGVFVAMMAAVLMCVGGYMNFRTKFMEAEEMTEKDENDNREFQAVEVAKVIEKAPERPFTGGLRQEAPTETVSTIERIPVSQQAEVTQATQMVNNNYSEREIRAKTEYERSKMYENLKKMMIKDTLSPEQRRKEREKQAKDNAFSANFGKSEPISSSASPARLTGGIDDLLRKGNLKKSGSEQSDKPAEKKPQMYRMDL